MRAQWTHVAGAFVLASGLLAWAGCKDHSAQPSPDPKDRPAEAVGDAKGGTDAHGHSHVRGKMLIEDVGKHHALLTAHLSSKEGNELDIFFETADEKNPQPVAIPAEPLKGHARL